MGCPDVSLIGQLSGIFEVDIQNLLAGELSPNGVLGGNLKRIKFYVCPNCGNLVYALTDVSITCCGKKMKPITPVKASEEEKLSVQVFENDFFVSSQHEMTREHYISFVALLTSDTIMLKNNIQSGTCRCGFLFLPMAGSFGIAINTDCFIRRCNGETRAPFYTNRVSDMEADRFSEYLK